MQIIFTNPKSNLGKTSLVYHLAWMFAERGIRVLAADLDPQSNLSAMFLEEERLAGLWEDGGEKTISGILRSLLERDVCDFVPHVEPIEPRIGLLVGNLALLRFEEVLAESWPRCLAGQEAAFRVITAFHRIVLAAASQISAEVVLIDVGSNLGAIHRSVLIAAEEVVIPLTPDAFLLPALENLGATMHEWRTSWAKFLGKFSSEGDIPLPEGKMAPLGYVVMRRGVRNLHWSMLQPIGLEHIPAIYRQMILGESADTAPSLDEDPYNLSLLKHYRSLMPMAMEAHKPMFFLKTADGAIGSHLEAVRACYDDFLNLSKRILR